MTFLTVSFRCFQKSGTVAGLVVAAGLFTILASSRSALGCNIPVFRYALERWSSDPLQLHLIVRGSQLRDSDRRTIRHLTRTTDQSANLIATVWDLETGVALPEFLTELNPEEMREPWCLIRSSGGAEPARVIWSSPLREVTADLIETSPAREQLVQMLLQGDSAVWLVLRGDDDTRTDATVRLLTATLRQIEDETPLPEGIGLPGSELYSDVPLMVSFPVLEVDPDDPAERLFVQHLRRFLPRSSPAPQTPAHTAAASQQPQPALIVPVFGRGRALVVMTDDETDAATVRDLAGFLSGACSCQVKRMNPGFDLLLRVDWKQQLFGDRAADIPADSLQNDSDPGVPTLVVIPPGQAGQTVKPAASASGAETADDPGTDGSKTSRLAAGRLSRQNSATQASVGRFVWLTGGFAGVVALSSVLSSLPSRQRGRLRQDSRRPDGF